MASEQECGAPNMSFSVNENPSNKKWNSSSKSITAAPDNINGCFDCNICLDTSHDPVVTLCGHLYCWPCIYKWLRVQNQPTSEPKELPKCPVCKAHISSSSLVPLYGRGTSTYDSEIEKPKTALNIPHRPQAPTSVSTDLHQQNRPSTYDHRQYVSHPFTNYPSVTPQTSTISFYNPTIHMVGEIGEMVFARMFGSSETSLFAYPYSNSYSHPYSGNGSPRLRRQEMQLDKSLNRVSIFLFCCIVLCLILF